MTKITYQEFLNDHRPQLVHSAIPEIYWETIYTKLIEQTFDAGNIFSLMQIEYDVQRNPEDPTWALQINVEEGIQADDKQHVYLVDHAWTFRMEDALKQLEVDDSLKQRMASIVGCDPEEERNVLTQKIFNEMWKYCCFYCIGSATQIEDRLAVWFIMDEVGSAIHHSDDPNFRVVPFIYIPEQLGVCLIYPLKNLKCEEVITRDFLEGVTDSLTRSALSLPWKKSSLTKHSFDFVPQDEKYFTSGHILETLPIKENFKSRPEKKEKYKVYCEYDVIKKALNDPRFEFVINEEDADILWYTKHFKYYEQLSETPEVFVNQFPFEYIITIKDLLAITCRRKNKKNFNGLESLPVWLPTTYNLQTEIVQFVSYYQKRQEKGLNNLWIIKPFNLARGLDMHITDNLNYIMRSATTRVKIAQKYIENPVLFDRDDVGKVKFDIRYVILLKSVKPLDVAVYKEFFLRFANKEFELNSFDDYEKHYTVMNYTETATLKHMLCSEFKGHWKEQYPNNPWEIVEESIFSMLKEAFECAVMLDPPCGICDSPQSRAVYAADLMLTWNGEDMQPKLLEINWTPDCQRACDYYKHFYDDIFKFLFLNEINIDTIKPL
ncbi:tubulin--tyrosine ligase-like protein 12 [Onthophagus taurus]|uniref:tubulin--tyrosine ligase-like protein 12 n=1 Tax=Onthophagus taurus TaxID=166361 RepID=UPI0039BE1BD1